MQINYFIAANTEKIIKIHHDCTLILNIMYL